MTLSNDLVSARVHQQFIVVVNGLHGDGEASKNNGDVFRTKKGRQNVTERPKLQQRGVELKVLSGRR